MHRVDAVGNSLGVRRELTEGIRSLPGDTREFARRRLRLAGRLLGVAEKLAGNDVVGSRQEFARRFAEGIRKLARNTPGDRRKTCHKNAGGCWIGGMAVYRCRHLGFPAADYG
ncbi:hypothetical protein BHE74_00041200 [Ensete ventricosum]|nr:hypothetical protein GW17_00012773 [Ensete ventricosum]RWW52377.1 hypothetical protein BHE74_00041200 [Ensete ventricosum]